MIRLALVVGLVAGAATADETKKDAEAARDREKLQGTWKVVAWETSGQPDANPGRWTFIFEKDRFTISKKGQPRFKGTFVIDATRTPKTIDLMITETGGRPKRERVLGLYELSGDVLKFAGGDDKGRRPAGFGSTAGNEFVLGTLERQRK
jgi:uncharacterized protein (TIGR03067 family)